MNDPIQIALRFLASPADTIPIGSNGVARVSYLRDLKVLVLQDLNLAVHYRESIEPELADQMIRDLKSGAVQFGKRSDRPVSIAEAEWRLCVGSSDIRRRIQTQEIDQEYGQIPGPQGHGRKFE